jgi:ArsR family transcriptional regulator, arsenate/arsenite/antimonite-responsive transcriptional repressor
MRLSEVEFMRVAKALADSQRCEILQRAASAGELCCSGIVSDCGVSQQTISHHLKELYTAGLLDRRKDGQFAYYRFRPETMDAYLTELRRRMRPGARAARGPDHGNDNEHTGRT